MASVFGTLKNLQEFHETVFRGETVIANRPIDRWNGCDKVANQHLNKSTSWGGFMNELSFYIGELHIPPAEIPDIILQHLLMLKVAVHAMEDAGLPLRKDRPRMGAIIGIDFDFEATDFHQRWHLHNEVQMWKKRSDLDIHLDDEEKTTRWLESLRDEFRPPLTATRTLGALGGIIASRIAREFRFGGPSYVVSNETASGLKALEIGMRSLQLDESDAVLVGAVDLFGDVRSVVTWDQIRPFTGSHSIRPFDHSADGTLPGEGAAALILKRLDKAEENGDRIYSVLKGIGKASGGGVNADSPAKDAYTLSIKRSLKDAGTSPTSISFVECHGSGNPLEDQIELEALNEVFSGRLEPCAIGSVKPNIGYTGAASGLASLVKTSLCLYNEIIPPLKNFVTPGNNIRPNGKLHMPAFPQYWVRNRKDGPRIACSAAMTTDGNYMHVILEGREYGSYDLIPQKVSRERKRPLGLVPFGLFVVDGNKESELLEGLDALRLHIRNSPNKPDRTLSSGKKSPRGDEKIEQAARTWYLNNRPNQKNKFAVSIVANTFSQLETAITDALAAISSSKPCFMDRSGGACYSPSPLGINGEVAFVFPGSGNHYLGMGRILGVQWPDILRRMDAETLELKTQLIPNCYVPWRTSWEPGWEAAAHEKIAANPLNMIFGQVAHGGVVANLMASFGVKPGAVIGYSLGESAGLFAMRVWPDRGKMLARMLDSDLFTKHLAGPCNAVRKAWKIPNDENVNWCTAVVNRPAGMVKEIISKWPFARLLIVNTPDQCVIGGRKQHVESAIHELRCEAVFLEGVATVHCDAATPVAETYKKLHMFPATPPEGLRFYSCARGRSYNPSSENAASSILEQAMSGFNFTTLIKQAYQDGIRIFLEMGPHASCTGMIDSILDKKPHLALSACVRGEDDVLTILKFIGALIAERVPVDLDKLYGDDFFVPTISEISQEKPNQGTNQIKLPIGSKTPSPSLPITKDRIPSAEARRFDALEKSVDDFAPDVKFQATSTGYSEMMSAISKNIEKTAEAHKAFLDFSKELTDNVAKTYSFQTHLLENVLANKEHVIPNRHKPALSRNMCLEFATGSVAKVLGPEFAVIDTYKVRVRLPDEPLMLVDRIISVEGQKRSMGSGRVVTEHDVLSDAWYLDGGRVPVCIAVEAGQADLFLCSYLGIDHAVKGERNYRLLDAIVKFHRGLPCPGDTIRYEIEIDHFVQQGDTYLFFFSFEGFIGESRLISMFNGCAGFFTEEEVSSSGGIILTEEDTTPLLGKKDPDWIDLVPLHTESYDDDAVEALRQGNLSGCFGPLFDGIELAESLRLPGDRMKLIHRILLLDPHGGRYGLGLIRAEADIHADDWFLTCHFMDDMVMPGTLMYECCAHTLRVFIQRLGWVTSMPGVCYEPVVGIESILKCRGPVTPETKHVWYEVEIKEIGYAPEPFVIANALMYADGHRIVSFKNISIKMTGIGREDIEATWKQANQRRQKAKDNSKTPVFYDRDSILAFAVGRPSTAFGEPYRVFDQERTIARLPGPPYSFLDSIVAIEPEAWVLKPDGWIEAEYEVPAEAWYFKADRSASMPFCVLLEIALQPCGWLAAYLGSALRSETDLKFRNLGGNAVLKSTIHPEEKKLTIRARMTKVSEAAEMIIEHFEFIVLQDTDIVYSGETYFGFFSKQALAQQVGIRGAEKLVYHPTLDELKRGLSFVFDEQAPLSPDDPHVHQAPSLAMPANALLMIDRVEIYVRNGGSKGLGYIRGIKHVKPGEWFFKAHFFQDPVCPGSLGIESFLQLIKFVAIDRWKHLADNHRFELITDQPHNWIYRGQVLPENKKIEVEAVITDVIDTPVPTIYANGFLKVDGLYIYQMENFGFRLVPV